MATAPYLLNNYPDLGIYCRTAFAVSHGAEAILMKDEAALNDCRKTPVAVDCDKRARTSKRLVLARRYDRFFIAGQIA